MNKKVYSLYSASALHNILYYAILEVTMRRLVVCLVFVVSYGVCDPLEDYVNKYDPHYRFEEIASYRGHGYTNYMLNMTSQKWKSDRFSNHAIWWHNVTITVPDKIVSPGHSLLFLGGGRNTGLTFIDDGIIALVTWLAVTGGIITAHVQNIPNEPIQFKNDPHKKWRSGESLLAWSFKEFLNNTQDPEVVIQLPMTKAAVRGMDTVTKYLKSKRNLHVQNFVVSGASKRAWAAWLTAAVDKRVSALVPIEFDLLNMTRNLHHYYRSMGGWTFALREFYATNYTQFLDTAKEKKLENIVDPLSYIGRYTTIPKLIIKSTGDEFFLLDNTDYYYNKLPGTTYLRVFSNAEHTLIGHLRKILETVKAFTLSAITKTPFPKLKWKREKTSSGGKIILWTDHDPKSVNCYYARTFGGQRRDFRLLVGSKSDPRHEVPNPIIWFKDKVQHKGNNTYMAEYEFPSTGWFAFFIEAVFPGTHNTSLSFTTEVMIIPDTFPFPDCHGEGCRGHLV